MIPFALGELIDDRRSCYLRQEFSVFHAQFRGLAARSVEPFIRL